MCAATSAESHLCVGGTPTQALVLPRSLLLQEVPYCHYKYPAVWCKQDMWLRLYQIYVWCQLQKRLSLCLPVGLVR